MVELLGWAGAACILGAYLWVTFHQPSFIYHAVNLVGCLLLVVNVWYHRAWPSVAINVTWAAIAISGLVKESRKKTLGSYA